MKKNELMNKATQLFGKATLELKKHSPEILVVSGIVGLVASAVVACKASTKVTDIVTEAKGQVEDIHANEEEYKKLSEISNDSYDYAVKICYFDNFDDAYFILCELTKIVCDYGVVSVQDYYDLINESNKLSDSAYGWHSLKCAKVIKVCDKYAIDLPKPEHI